MKEETLNKLKIYINNERKVLELKKRRLNEARELEHNDSVRRYLELCGIETATGSIRIDDENTEMKVFNSFLKNISSNETNKVFIYAGTYNIDMQRVKASSIDAEYRKYWDIEQEEPVLISIDDCALFESENIVIVASIDSVRKDFLETTLSSNQDSAIKLIKNKYKTRI